ncbi:Rieske 2Fe-2S domain-containing protein [Nocardiopsis mangrovi]|uniref:Rieske 2Fe-2S domain-containing protein n=1 Tax=Nocardiopsis mangrovi TaxID=1179818 RepID=A0ABV9E284_9ACTN
MTGRVRIEFGPGDNTVRVGDELYFRFERQGTVSVLRSRCPHRGGPLHLGSVQGEEPAERLHCPWHGSAFPVSRLCAKGVPTVQVHASVVAYPPVAPGTPASTARQIVFAR